MHMCVDKARNNFESTRAEVERLMKRIRSAEEDFKAPSCFTMEGYLYIQEKRELFLSLMLWTKSDARITQSGFLLLKHIHPCTSAPAWKCASCIVGPLGSVWTRYYCTYEKSTKMFTMSNTEARPASRQVSRQHRWITTPMLLNVLAH